MPKKPQEDRSHAPRRRPKLTAVARAQAQRDAFSRRVARAAAMVLATTPQPKDGGDGDPFPWRAFYKHVKENPVRGVNNVTGMPY